METTLQLLVVVALLVIIAEVTYLVTKLPKQAVIKKQGRLIFVDTSVLIDGRIISVAKSGFLSDTLVVPRSVVGELQFLADNADHDKRARARYGLDVVTELQSIPQVEVEILQDGSKADEGVDERLLKLAKEHTGAICTIDYNLNKVAVVEGITVLNINELAQTLRMAYLPGEKMLLELVQKGQDSHQGVGYLPDGTMVVVENASKYIGTSVEIEFIRSLQTAAGKMMFARLVGNDQSNNKQQRPGGKKPVRPVESAPQDTKQKQQQAVYHSDSNDRRQMQQKKAQQRPQRPSTSSKQQKSTKKAPSSAQREAALIDLVDKQS